jgi:hypothetical protein
MATFGGPGAQVRCQRGVGVADLLDGVLRGLRTETGCLQPGVGVLAQLVLTRDAALERHDGHPVGPLVDTSQQCSQCDHIDRKNRVDQATFACRACGFLTNADDNASHNIARKGEAVWTAGRESRVPATP